MRIQTLVSVNIRTFNSAKTLLDTLESVKNQTHPNIEVVICDGYSKDKSVEIAESYGARVIFADKLGDARYENFKKSKGKYIFSLDSDQILDPGLVEKCVDLCKKKKLDALTISEKSLINKGTFVERLLAYDKWVIDKNRDDDVVFGTACPRFFKREFLKKIKWPKQLAIFDDTILYSELLKRGARVDYLSTQSIRHNEVTDWFTLARKYYRYGKGYLVALKETPGTIAAHSLPRRSYFSTVALSKPHYFLGLLLLYLVKASAVSAGAISYLIVSLFSRQKS